jgi:hypothetical protein
MSFGHLNFEGAHKKLLDCDKILKLKIYSLLTNNLSQWLIAIQLKGFKMTSQHPA